MVNPFRERGSAEVSSAISGSAARVLGEYPTPPPLPDLHDPGRYLGFFAKTLDSAIFPRKSRRAFSSASGTDGKSGARRWIYGQVRTGAINLERFNQDSVGAVGIISAHLFHGIGDCRLPLNFGPAVAAQ